MKQFKTLLLQPGGLLSTSGFADGGDPKLGFFQDSNLGSAGDDASKHSSPGLSNAGPHLADSSSGSADGRHPKTGFLADTSSGSANAVAPKLNLLADSGSALIREASSPHSTSSATEQGGFCHKAV